ncbi:MAG TPA: HAMP domain-containing sensor histidine kinase [Ktedonobacteraceae bacterium]|nr:HAMP domain-containing sensor histidine kinase [Ktedonobacteraceae bacterium]
MKTRTHRWTHPRTPGIRIQLALWYLLVFAVLVLCAGLLLYTQVQRSLESSMDSALVLRAQTLSNGISVEGGTINISAETSGIGGYSGEQTGSHEDVNFGTLTSLLDAHGRPVRMTSAFHSLIIPAVSVTQPLHGSPWRGTVTTATGQRVRLYSMPLTTQDHTFAILQVGESLTQQQDALHSLLLEMCVIGPLILLLGAAGSYWLAARAFVPIDRVTRAARQIEVNDLHQRVPLPKAHDEVYRLAVTFNTMIERLEAAFQHQRRFVADASHELRTPVTAIHNLAEMALLEGGNLDACTTALHDITGETERLGHLISGLLALARADEGKTILEQEVVHLEQLVGAVVAYAQPLATECAVTMQLSVSQPVVVIGDESRLIQVVMNLLENALHYTNRGGKVTITLTTNEHVAHLIISDTGIGIADDHLPHIFERFYRVDPARGRTEDNRNGLGLSIVEWIVRAHDGQMKVESAVGQGSTFHVFLPLPDDDLAYKLPAATRMRSSGV